MGYSGYGDGLGLESYQPMSEEEIDKWESAHCRNKEKFEKQKVVRLNAECKSLKRALEQATDFISERFGSCPNDMFDWEHPGGCSVVCQGQLSNCWARYFKGKN